MAVVCVTPRRPGRARPEMPDPYRVVGHFGMVGLPDSPGFGHFGQFGTAGNRTDLARWELHFVSADPVVVWLSGELAHDDVLAIVPSAVAAVGLGSAQWKADWNNGGAAES
jgi:hypothetical protein